MTSTTTFAPIRTSIRRPASEDPFRSRFGHDLPAGLRAEARGMNWRTFTATYAPTPSLRIHNVESTKLRAGKFRFEATLTQGHGKQRRSRGREITASGPISACTHLLADAGRSVEILEFHQFKIFEATVIFIHTCHHNTKAWAMGFGATVDAAAASALSAAAERLHG